MGIILTRRSIVALSGGLVVSGAMPAPVASSSDQPIRYGSTPPAMLPTAHGGVSPLGWPIRFFDDFTTFVASTRTETARTGATDRWATELSPGTHHVSGQKEQEYYCNPCWTPGINPFHHAGSILTITASVPTPAQMARIRRLKDYQDHAADAPYISGALNTWRIFPKGLLYGYFELNCKLPVGSGMWTAFWLNYRGEPYSPEIDIMEQIGSQPHKTTGTLHFDPKKKTHVPGVNTLLGVDLTKGFHTYGGLWTPNYTAWYFDGRLLGMATEGRRSGIGYYNDDNPMDLIINFAMGTGMDDPPVTAAQLPAHFQIDWFRYSALGPA